MNKLKGRHLGSVAFREFIDFVAKDIVENYERSWVEHYLKALERMEKEGVDKRVMKKAWKAWWAIVETMQDYE